MALTRNRGYALRGRKRLFPAAIALLSLTGAALVSPSGARANDSMAELSVGGLNFVRSADVAMESEVLSISPQNIVVTYQFRNLTSQPVTAQIAFPLPDLDLSDPDLNLAIPSSDPLNFVGFATKVDGAPIKFDVLQKAVLNGKDVSGAVRAAGLPIMLIGNPQAQIDKLPDAAKAKLVDAGLVI